MSTQFTGQSVIRSYSGGEDVGIIKVDGAYVREDSLVDGAISLIDPEVRHGLVVERLTEGGPPDRGVPAYGFDSSGNRVRFFGGGVSHD